MALLLFGPLLLGIMALAVTVNVFVGVYLTAILLILLIRLPKWWNKFNQ